MKSKCKPIVLSKKDKIKNIVLGLIICYLLVLFFICTLIRDYSETHLSDDIVWIILLFIAVVIITIIFIRDLQRILALPDWSMRIDQSGIYCNDETGEFCVEWVDIKKIVLVHTRDSILSMEVTTNIGKRKVIDLSLCSLYPYRVHRLARMYSCGKCQVVDKNSLKG